MTIPEASGEDAKKADRWTNVLTGTSLVLLVWNLFGIELSSKDTGVLGLLARIPKGVVPPVLIFGVVLASWRLYVWSALPSPAAKHVFIRRNVDLVVNYLLGATSIASYFSGLNGRDLLTAIKLSPICLIFAAAGWMLVIPSAYALLRAPSGELSSQGLIAMGPVIVSVGLLAIWVSVSIAGNLWPAWIGVWVGLLPGVMIALGWRRS